ncbi:INPP5B [Scenedesmus sp. PABB004]|nr:INPP5B [Scenedesmus sp. PABB004]
MGRKAGDAVTQWEEQQACWQGHAALPELPGAAASSGPAAVGIASLRGIRLGGSSSGSSSSPDLLALARGTRGAGAAQPRARAEPMRGSSSCGSFSLLGGADGGSPSPGQRTSAAPTARSRLFWATAAGEPREGAAGAAAPPPPQGSQGGSGAAALAAAAAAAASGDWALERPASSCSLGDGGAGGRTLRLHIVTFNMAGCVPSAVPPELLAGPPGGGGAGAAAPEVDLYVFATQESGALAEWERLLAAALPPGGGYARLAWQSLRGMHLVLFASARFRRQVVGVRGSAVPTGLGNVVGNKGAVALAVTLPDVRLLFIGSHFAAHADQVERRNADYARVRAGLFAGGAGAFGGGGGGRRSGASSHSGSARGSGAGSPTAGHLAQPAARGRSASPRGWLSGARRVAPEPWAPCSGAGSRASPCPSDGGGSSAAAALEGSVGRLRAASWTASCCTSGAPGRAAELCPLHCACGSEDGRGSSSAGTPSSYSPGPGGGGLTFAEELRSQLSFLAPFAARRPSASLLHPRAAGGPPDGTAGADVVFWVGDLNYRINGNARAVAYLLRTRLHEVLHANDQLRLQQHKGRVFEGFTEGRIHFPPTFKFVPGSNAYADARVPSWTDRILWRVPPRSPDAAGRGGPPAPRVAQLYYASVPAVTSSDHKPVVGGFEVALGADADAPRHDGDDGPLVAAGAGGGGLLRRAAAAAAGAASSVAEHGLLGGQEELCGGAAGVEDELEAEEDLGGFAAFAGGGAGEADDVFALGLLDGLSPRRGGASSGPEDGPLALGVAGGQHSLPFSAGKPPRPSFEQQQQQQHLLPGGGVAIPHRSGSGSFSYAAPANMARSCPKPIIMARRSRPGAFVEGDELPVFVPPHELTASSLMDPSNVAESLSRKGSAALRVRSGVLRRTGFYEGHTETLVRANGAAGSFKG